MYILKHAIRDDPRAAARRAARSAAIRARCCYGRDAAGFNHDSPACIEARASEIAVPPARRPVPRAVCDTMAVAALRLCAMLCCPLLLLLAAAAAQSLPPAAPPEPCPDAAAHVMRSATKLCGGTPVAASLQSVGIGGDRTGAMAELLAKHGFQTALDLRLLRAGGPDEAELMGQLRAGRISIGDRSKVRLLLGVDGSELHSGNTHQQCGPGSDRADAGFTRQLQDGVDQGMSVDTIAIVASVLVGAAGYLVQAYTARRAEQSTAAHAQELHLHEQTRQREHEQMLSQIARVDRWLDDCARLDASVLSCCVGLPARGRD
eukprot:SAG31_NODE_5648_length_2404_cov_2.372234_1_plen_319_part_00